jgi:hypothetical protein
MIANRQHEELRCDFCGAIASRYCEICGAQYCRTCATMPDEGGFDCADEHCGGAGYTKARELYEHMR